MDAPAYPSRRTCPVWRPQAGRGCPERPAVKGKTVRCGARLPMPPTGRIRPMPFHPSRMMPHEVGRARHARHTPDIGKAMSGRKKR